MYFLDPSLVLVFGSNHEFELSCSPLQVEEVLLQVRLLRFKGRDLVLELPVFVLLIKIRLLHILLSLKHIVREVFPDLLRLPSQSVIQGFFLRAQVLNFFFVKV